MFFSRMLLFKKSEFFRAERPLDGLLFQPTHFTNEATGTEKSSILPNNTS